MDEYHFNEPEPLINLIKALKRLPGIGIRSARRIAYHLMQYDLDGAGFLSKSLSDAVASLRHCVSCNGFSETELCFTCASDFRDKRLLCIVENPSDQNSVESSHGYKGLYYVLMGRVSPLDGVGPKELNFQKIFDRVHAGNVEEVIIATGFTAEGETTAQFLIDMFSSANIKTSRLARGVPAGSELEYIDAGTIAWALIDRKIIN
ncbi:recombination protein RecR [Candidatus Kinetoplastibacterium desouzaii TCC079E]|uniref:Recombination protein RecR n=1 Tax=Candidatus Kinetoplastidibacterium desouzai TCC079E TaxID=1208919 RepID=M1M352_9PROT|nr:recombination mediator RecR [Candidatus Kinetoplastibacterium desouzaii]AGF46695.1 recombination protein RecR [Candidatus Kinetoplastibacterium desouzaii TCC079E]